MDKKLSTAEALGAQPKKTLGTKVPKLERRDKAKQSKTLGRDLDGAYRVNNRMDGK